LQRRASLQVFRLDLVRRACPSPRSWTFLSISQPIFGVARHSLSGGSIMKFDCFAQL